MTINQEIRSGTEVTTGRRKPSELVAEYEHKRDLLADACNAYAQSGQDFLRSASVGGAWGDARPDIASPNITIAERHLLQSAWRHFYTLYDLSSIMTASDKRKAEMLFAKPPAFTVENIREHFGAYIGDPWGTILRGLAEVFVDLDPAYKSHEKMKIGVKGLPKRVILSRVTEHGSYGRDKLRDILNALAAYQGKPLVTYTEINMVTEVDGEALKTEREIPDPKSLQFKTGDYDNAPRIKTPARDAWLKTYANGNGHLYFGPTALRDINRALAEFYGEVLPDCPEERSTKARPGTDVAKDLQYYPTPVAVVDRVIADIYPLKGKIVLEPSCGCGRFMDALRRAGADVTGIEVDLNRANQARDKGHAVLKMNFLTTVPIGKFDRVVMNPPFYGRHYVKHVRHALKFLKPGGVLTAILPATARYDHGELDDLNPQWSDLPVGSFKESGTNINTTVATIKRAA